MDPIYLHVLNSFSFLFLIGIGFYVAPAVNRFLGLDEEDQTMFGCHMINFNYTVHFDTFEEALAYGLKSGFQFTIIEESE